MNTLIRSRPYYKGVTHELMSPSQRTGKLRYEPDTIVEANGLDEDPNQDCGKGINFCHTLAQALRWGPVVVELTVPDGETIIDAGDKLRAKRIRVEAVADLSSADLRGANLRDAIVDSNTIIPLPRGWVVGDSVIRRDDEPIG